MKRVFVVFLVLVLVAGVIFAQQRFSRGTYTGTAASFNSATRTPNGTIKVEVTFNATKMTRITIKEHTDTPLFISMVEQDMIPAMIAAQSVDVDNVSGATYTSTGMKAAVTDAITQARR